MNIFETRYALGGLMRCCLQTLIEAPLDMEVEEGCVLDCKFEGVGSQRMVLKSGVWIWNNLDEQKEIQDA